MNPKALPFPVLGRLDDFVDSQFQVAIDAEVVREGERESVRLRYFFMLSNSEIQELLNKRLASFALDVRCIDTLYREVHFLEGENGYIDFEGGVIYGKVVIEPSVTIRSDVTGFFASDFHPEFHGSKFNLRTGDQIALDTPVVKFIEFDRLHFESLVKIEVTEAIDPDTYQIDLSTDLIVILMGVKVRKVWDACWQDKERAPFLALSVYKDVVLAALDTLSNSEEDSDGRKWGRALKQKLSLLGVKVPEKADFLELNPIAQRLVSRHGIQRILKSVS